MLYILWNKHMPINSILKEYVAVKQYCEVIPATPKYLFHPINATKDDQDQLWGYPLYWHIAYLMIMSIEIELPCQQPLAILV